MKTALIKIGFKGKVESFEKSINSAAELASEKALLILMDAIKQMSIKDALSILNGEDNAATIYLQNHTYKFLYSEFKPIVIFSMKEVQIAKQWNKLIKKGTDDPIIPAYNTPEHKFNLGFAARDISILNTNNWGFSMNYKWIEGFIFEGSPQFTGKVPTYDQLDAQINKSIPEISATIKVGASNLLNNFSYQVYGGPRVGRMLYSSLVFDIN